MMVQRERGLNKASRRFFQHRAAIGWHCCVIRRIALATTAWSLVANSASN
jgi:hypothetical protein